jgi:DNA polymerase III, alpha subunit
VTGFYVSEHPMGMYQKQLSWFDFKPFAIMPPDASGQEPVLLGCGLLKTRRDIVTKKGDRMAFVQLEEMNGGCAELVVFPKLFKAVEEWLDTYQVFAVKGSLDMASDKICKIKADTLVPLDLIFQNWPNIQHITIGLPEQFTEKVLQEIKTLFKPGTIPLQLAFTENNKQLALESKEKIAISADILTALSDHPVTIKIGL